MCRDWAAQVVGGTHVQVRICTMQHESARHPSLESTLYIVETLSAILIHDRQCPCANLIQRRKHASPSGLQNGISS
ncbi:hypothetical protein CH063_14749 [Colletotrichum higginsianum]|uniref:Uncharacterized protein n=1 Tax=Colletotrichum higginsianum (strain IMI 349063) TaxID=759273 RepID=H1VZX5_COLHI|nr:hypothetical protein CH063_14749 [Colletotrichum higginsianum]